jgi:hypothetical protein
VAQAAAHHLDGDAAVDQFAGMRVAELVDADPDAFSGAALLPPAVGAPMDSYARWSVPLV